MASMTTLAKVLPIIEQTYGESAKAQGLAKHLARKIDAHPANARQSLGSVVSVTCWEWYGGEDKPARVADEIEAAL